MKKGPLAEAQIVGFLRETWFPNAERRVMGGNRDRGDVSGIPGVTIEIKNRAEMQLAEWVDEANREAANGPDGEIGIVWHKRRGKGSPGDWYVTMDGWTATGLIVAAVKERGR